VEVDVLYKYLPPDDRLGVPNTIATETRELDWVGAVVAFMVGEIVTLPTSAKSTWSSNASRVFFRPPNLDMPSM
jgi:hypothetical protein